MRFINIKDHGLAEDEMTYLINCARIRRVSVTYLVRLLLKTIARDQMVLSVLDDDSKPAKVIGRKPKNMFPIET